MVAALVAIAQNTNFFAIRRPCRLHMIDIAGGQAANRRGIAGIVGIGGGSGHDEEVGEAIKEAASIEPVADGRDGAQAYALVLVILFLSSFIQWLASHQRLIIVMQSHGSRKGDPATIRGPGGIADAMQHRSQLACLAAIGINQPELIFLPFAVGEEEQAAIIGRPYGVGIVFTAAGQPFGGANGMALCIKM